jgi:hypothetical protein
MEDFASGASSLPVLASLLKGGFRVFEIPDLHAKIILASNEFVSVGSQNLTARGIRNREATYCSEIPDEVAQIEKMLTPWIESANPITIEMVEEAIRLLPPLEQKFGVLQREAAKVETAVRAAAAKREEVARIAREEHAAAINREAERVAEVIRVRHRIATLARDVIDRRIPEGKVPLELAKTFIRRCTWWNTHVSGFPVLARRHAERITGSDGDWKVKFGANSFLVGRAICRCFKTLRQYVETVESGAAVEPSFIVGFLRWDVASSVAGYDDSDLGRYPISGDDMMFGATSINVKHFIRELLEHLPIEIATPISEANEHR